MKFFSVKKPESSGQRTSGKVKKKCYPGCAMRCGRKPVVPAADVRAGKARG